MFQTGYKSKAVSDRWATSMSLPVAPPVFPAEELGLVTARLAMELWETAVRLEISLALVRSFPSMFEMRDRISDRVHSAIGSYLPGLGPLKSVLDAVARHFPFATDIDPLHPLFPYSDFRSITMTIPSVVDRDATTLENYGAIPTLRTNDDAPLPYWAGIDFEVPPRPLPVGPRKAVSLGHPFHPAYHASVIQEACRFRMRLDASPHATLLEMNVTILPTNGHSTRGVANSANKRSSASVVVSAAAENPVPPKAATPVRPKASPGFSTVDWYGTKYTFTPKERKIVEVLWDAAEQGMPELSLAEILEEARFKKDETLREIFKGNLAWQTMIKSVTGRKGVYALNVPKGHVFPVDC
jgi:hypothetical protein